MKHVLFLLLVVSFFGFGPVGRSLPTVELTTLDELEIRLARGKDTTYVVNLWATWCAPCVEEMPYFESVAKQYEHKPFKLLFLSLDSPKKPSLVQGFVAKKGIHNEVLLLNEYDQQAYIDRISQEWSGAIPATLLVNVGANKSAFHEREFSQGELEDTIGEFVGAIE